MHFFNLYFFLLLHRVTLSKLCYAKITLMFGSDFSILCAGSLWFWRESAFFFPQRKGSEKLPATPEWTREIFVSFGGTLPVLIRSYLLCLGELHLSILLFFLCLWELVPYGFLITQHWKFFLNLQKYLVLQLFICAKLLIANYILATFSETVISVQKPVKCQAPFLQRGTAA